ncbi:hypothetical protein DY000_02032052 [Brassica cretica]|uniref:Uncharacterized protein n=1 Tax=Brassica cretica TaxID=69181 RepID=A0ABQ7DXC7_BRACR|nr:hypothetical protein DY000_02032052 [Brassica cretica]
MPPPELKADGTLRFPWAARLGPQSRNLYREASPTYRLDGTPEVSIPSKVFRLGPENKDEYVIGKFHKCSLPPGGLVHVVVNRLWRRSYVSTESQVAPAASPSLITSTAILSDVLSAYAGTTTPIMETVP